MRIQVFILALLAVGSMASGGNHITHLTGSDFSEKVADGKVRPSSNKLIMSFSCFIVGCKTKWYLRCAGVLRQVLRTMVRSLQETCPYLGRVRIIGGG